MSFRIFFISQKRMKLQKKHFLRETSPCSSSLLQDMNCVSAGNSKGARNLKTTKVFRQLAICDRGATLIEYGLLAAMIGVGAITALQALGVNVQALLMLDFQPTVSQQQVQAEPPPTAHLANFKGFLQDGTYLPGGDGFRIYTNTKFNEWNGWMGSFEVGTAKTYNALEGKFKHLLELDATRNSEITKEIDVPPGKKVRLDLETILPDSDQVKQGEDGFEVVWNGKVVKTVLPGSKEWTKDYIDLPGERQGTPNELTIRSIGVPNGHGALIGNFKVGTLDS